MKPQTRHAVNRAAASVHARNRKRFTPFAAALASLSAAVSGVSAAPFEYDPIPEQDITSAMFTIDLAEFTAHRTIFGEEVNRVLLRDPTGQAPDLDLSDQLFGVVTWPAAAEIDMAPAQTSLVSVSIDPSFFSVLASGSVGLEALLTDTGDGVFAYDYIGLEIETVTRSTVLATFGTNNGYGLGVPDNASLPDAMPGVLMPTGTGEDSEIGSIFIIPAPGTFAAAIAGTLLCARPRRRSLRAPARASVAPLVLAGGVSLCLQGGAWATPTPGACGTEDCPMTELPFGQGTAHTTVNGNGVVVENICFATGGRVLAGVVDEAISPGFEIREFVVFTDQPSIDVIVTQLGGATCITPFPLGPSTELHAAGLDCKAGNSAIDTDAFAVTDRGIFLLGTRFTESGPMVVLDEIPFLPGFAPGVLPVSAAGIGTCDDDCDLIIFNLCVERDDDKLHCVFGTPDGPEELIVDAMAPFVTRPISFTNGPRGGVVLLTANRAITVEAGMEESTAFGSPYASHTLGPNGVITVMLDDGSSVFLDTAPGSVLMPFANCAMPMAPCTDEPTVAMNIEPCEGVIDGASALWPPPGVSCEIRPCCFDDGTCEVTSERCCEQNCGIWLEDDDADCNDCPRHYALIIGNNEYAPEADVVAEAFENWDMWNAPVGNVTVRTNLTGQQILDEVRSWVAQIGENDVGVVYYTGYSGIRGETAGPGGDEKPGLAMPPDNDNDRPVDEVFGLRAGDARTFIDPASDDELTDALDNVHPDATLLVIMDTCYANGYAGGDDDLDAIPNAAAITACVELGDTRGDWTWSAFLTAICDGDGDGFADADRLHNPPPMPMFGVEIPDLQRIDVFDLGNWAIGRDPNTNGFTNLTEDTDRDIFWGCPEVPLPADCGGRTHLAPFGKGEHGSGLCSPFDFGDAPDDGKLCGFPIVARNYITTLANDGPRYSEWTLQKLGMFTDGEPDGLNDCMASSDDLNAVPNDEDGVTFGPNCVTVRFTIAHPDPHQYRIDAWWDLNDNGVFDEPGEHIIDFRPTLAAGEYFETFPLGFNPSLFYSRFRLTWVDPTTGVPPLLPGNVVPPFRIIRAMSDNIAHGEVEDYPMPDLMIPDILYNEETESDEVRAGDEASFTTTATWANLPVEGAALVYSAPSGNITFTSGFSSEDGTQAHLPTDANGRATMTFTGNAPGPGLIRVNVPGTNITTYHFVQITDEEQAEPCPGDADWNGVIDLRDVYTLVGHFGAKADARSNASDVNGDGVVDSQDLFALARLIGQPCPN
ncbi:MAG: caspase family protein [Phycisphaerales bacterium]